MTKRQLSLPDCARRLAKLQYTVAPEKRLLASTLAQQCKNYSANPDALRPMMLETINALQTKSAQVSRF